MDLEQVDFKGFQAQLEEQADMVKSGSFKVSQGSTAGRIGEGLGKGLGEAIPKEVAQQRLASGLKNFAENAQNLNPLQQAAQYLSIPGLSPQAQQILPQLIQQQKARQSYEGLGDGQQNPQEAYRQSAAQITPGSQGNQGGGLQTPESTQATLEHFIEPTLQEKVDQAKQLPLWNQDPEAALALVDQKVTADRNRNASLQQRGKNERDIQNTLKTRIGEGFNKLGVSIPGDLSQKLEQKGFNLIRPKDQGGQGMTEEAASREITSEADKIARQYAGVNTLGGIGSWLRNSESTYDKLGVLQKEFKERDDLRNFAQQVGNSLDISAPKYYSIAYPLQDKPKLFDFYKKLAPLKTGMQDPTDQIAPQLFDLMGVDGSPLSIANALNSKGYDGNRFLKYASGRQKELAPDQVNQLALPTSPTLGDVFIENMGGVKGVFGLVPLFYGMYK
jgi:hypothetical protein